jgi:hypothetical protein
VCLASPAISEGAFFVRSSTHVWALAETTEKRVFTERPPPTEATGDVPSAPGVATAGAKAAPAGQLTDPVEILKRADAAARAVQSARYDIVIEPSGAAKQRYPFLEASVTSAGWLQGLPERFRVEGVVRGPRQTDPVRLLGGSDGDVYYLVDNVTKTVHEDLEARVMGSRGRAVSLSIATELHHPEPFSQEIAGPVHELQGITDVEGEPCYKVRVVADADGSWEVIWYLSTNDLLPRQRQDTFAMPDGEKGMLQGTLRNLVVDPELDPGMFAVPRPDGYAKTDTVAP